METVNGHNSMESAYVVSDYPYGYTLRCKIRYWLEYDAKRGLRFCSQTTNPKKAVETWNKPKKSTYAYISAAMYIDDNGRVSWKGLSEYSDLKESLDFHAKYFDGVPDEAKKRLIDWIDTKQRYEDKLKTGMDFRTAGHETVLETVKNGGNSFIKAVIHE